MGPPHFSYRDLKPHHPYCRHWRAFNRRERSVAWLFLVIVVVTCSQLFVPVSYRIWARAAAIALVLIGMGVFLWSFAGRCPRCAHRFNGDFRLIAGLGGFRIPVKRASNCMHCDLPRWYPGNKDEAPPDFSA